MPKKKKKKSSWLLPFIFSVCSFCQFFSSSHIQEVWLNPVVITFLNTVYEAVSTGTLNCLKRYLMPWLLPSFQLFSSKNIRYMFRCLLYQRFEYGNLNPVYVLYILCRFDKSNLTSEWYTRFYQTVTLHPKGQTDNKIEDICDPNFLSYWYHSLLTWSVH